MGIPVGTRELRSALLLGIGRYDNNGDLPSLEGPRVDVSRMSAVLADPAIGAYQVDTLEDVTSTVACERLEGFLRDRSENEMCLIYYSGHGFIDARGALYLCTTNSSFQRPKTSTIPADFISTLIDECYSRRVVLMLDCCYSGNYDGSAKASNIVEPSFGGTGYGRVVLTAGAEGQVAWDNGSKGSLFTQYVTHGIQTGAADLDRDGHITVDELYRYVHREVTRENSRQRPGKSTYKESGASFLIAESPVKPPVVMPEAARREAPSVVTPPTPSSTDEMAFSARFGFFGTIVLAAIPLANRWTYGELPFYLGGSAIVAAHLSTLAVRYRVVPKASELQKEKIWLAGAISLLFSLSIATSLRDDTNAAFITTFAILNVAGITCLLGFALRLGLWSAIGFSMLLAFVLFAALAFAHLPLGNWGTFVIAAALVTPLLLLFGHVARSRYLKSQRE